MKRLLISFAVVSLALPQSAAQGLSGGIRTGASYWTQRESYHESRLLEAMPGGHIRWDREVFARREGKRRWAFEAGLMNGRLTERRQHDPLPGPQSFVQMRSHSMTRRCDQFDLSLSLQYDIGCAGKKACALLRRFRSYAGISVIPSLARIHTRRDFQEGTSVSEEYQFQAWMGLGHTLMYHASQRVTLSSVVEARIAPGEIFTRHYTSYVYRPAASAGIRLGVAYKFASRPAPKAETVL